VSAWSLKAEIWAFLVKYFRLKLFIVFIKVCKIPIESGIQTVIWSESGSKIDSFYYEPWAITTIEAEIKSIPVISVIFSTYLKTKKKTIAVKKGVNAKMFTTIEKFIPASWHVYMAKK
jgi:hypothetical protein